MFKPYRHCNDMCRWAFRRRLGHEDGAILSVISFLIQETAETSLTPSARKEHSEKMTISEPGTGPLPDTESVGTLIFNFPAS